MQTAKSVFWLHFFKLLAFYFFWKVQFRYCFSIASFICGKCFYSELLLYVCHLHELSAVFELRTSRKQYVCVRLQSVACFFCSVSKTYIQESCLAFHLSVCVMSFELSLFFTLTLLSACQSFRLFSVTCFSLSLFPWCSAEVSQCSFWSCSWDCQPSPLMQRVSPCHTYTYTF